MNDTVPQRWLAPSTAYDTRLLGCSLRVLPGECEYPVSESKQFSIFEFHPVAFLPVT